jgi:hypothetical protein
MKSSHTISNSFGWLTVSVLLSVLVIFFLIYINIQTALLYENSHGKDRALFGLIELINFGYKYWLIFPALLALTIGLLNWYRGGGKKAILISLLALVACCLIFIRFWLLWVKM